MRPVVTGAEMRAIDAAAQELTPVEELIERAGWAAARAALRMMGGAYGRRVVVVAGKGNNGADGRVAARVLAARGARVTVIDAAEAPHRLPAADLVIDAAYGTGFHGGYQAPSTTDPVLAVDIPSGVDGDTGEAAEGAVRAAGTVTFAALKPGLLLGEGPDRAGAVTVADIGLDCSGAAAQLVEDADVTALLPPAPRDTHKWRSAVGVVAGGPGMMGAAAFCATGAHRAGAGMVQLGVPGADPRDLPATEAVSSSLPSAAWGEAALHLLTRPPALVLGPGLGRSDSTRAAVRHLLDRARVPVVVDADGLHALGTGDEVAASLRHRPAPTVLTPHDGEFAALTGHPPGPDRPDAVRRLAAATGAVVLLKGPTTVVAAPGGDVLFVTAGSPRLATAGAGDVLSGVIGAFLARGVEPWAAAGLAAHVHGRAAARGRPVGLVASDLPALISDVLSDLAAGPDSGAGVGPPGGRR